MSRAVIAVVSPASVRYKACVSAAPTVTPGTADGPGDSGPVSAIAGSIQLSRSVVEVVGLNAGIGRVPELIARVSWREMINKKFARRKNAQEFRARHAGGPHAARTTAPGCG